MDVTSLSLFRSIMCSNSGQRQLFDNLFQHYISGDEDGSFRLCLDIIVDSGIFDATVGAVVYSTLFLSMTLENDPDSEMLFSLAAALLASDVRSNVVERQRLNWQAHVRWLRREGSFSRFYRMSYTSFWKLLSMLRPSLFVNSSQSQCRTSGLEPIYAEIILHCTLRYLAGGSYLDIMCNAGISQTAFYSCVYRGIDAINGSPELMLQLPRSLAQLSLLASEFASLSDRVLNGCVMALDGWLCQIKVQGANETPIVSSYFSGHYQCYGVNVQAACDAQSHFTYVCMLCPGGTGDSRAYQASKLRHFIDGLPPGFYAVADNAYTLSEHLIIPYCGVDKLDKSKDVCNFYISQLRIRVEQAFGLLVCKWRIFKKPIKLKLHRVQHVVQACFRLHNFCIDNRDEKCAVILTHDVETFVPNYEFVLPAVQTTLTVRTQHSSVHEAIRAQLNANGAQRPVYNVNRNS
jgi:hypothetical protein